MHDIVKIPRHCSYLSLAPDKGAEDTVPLFPISEFFGECGQAGGIRVSSSARIPEGGTDDPPHCQAANY